MTKYIIKENTMTKKAIEKLPEVCKAYCEAKKAILRKAVENGMQEIYTENSKKLRGYVEALSDTGVLNETEMRAIYLYYAAII